MIFGAACMFIGFAIGWHARSRALESTWSRTMREALLEPRGIFQTYHAFPTMPRPTSQIVVVEDTEPAAISQSRIVNGDSVCLLDRGDSEWSDPTSISELSAGDTDTKPGGEPSR